MPENETEARKAELASEAAGAESEVEVIEEAAEILAEGNPDEELGEAIETLEPAAGTIIEEALEAGRPDVAQVVAQATLTTLADWAQSADELAETLEAAAVELGTEEAVEAAAEASVVAEEAVEATAETLTEAGVDPALADMATEAMPDVPPEPAHWLTRRRFRR